MLNQYYRGLFEDWEVGVATNIINTFRNKWKCLKLEDFEDLLQECLISWDSAKTEYNPSVGANRRTFMAKVVENKLRHIKEKLTSDKRKIFTNTVSLDECISESEKEDSPTYSDRLSLDEDYADNLRIIVGLKIDVSRVVQKLSARQQELCRLLGEEGLSVKKASEVLKIPRGTLYEDIKRIEAIFQKENLREYLK